MTALWLRLLRDPHTAPALCEDAARRRELAAAALLAIALGGALFGAAVGYFRGGWQIPLAALKIPVVTLITMAVAGPALLGLASAFGRAWTFPRALALMLAAGARSSLVLAALAPVLWLAIDLGLPYQVVKVTATLSYGLAGLSGLRLLLRGLGDAPGRAGAAIWFTLTFLIAGAQTAWVLRPYLGDPRDEQVPVVVTDRVEGGVWGSLLGRGVVTR